MASLLSPQRPPCFHKTLARCMLNTPGCCACSDSRPHAHDYYVYVDGVGSVPQGTRWSYYCDHCKAYWESNIRRAGISASQSRIPEFPRPNLSDGSSTPRSPPGSRRTPASAFSQMEQYLTNNPLAHRPHPHPNRPLLSVGRAGRERDAEPSLASTPEPDSASQSDARRRLQRLQSLRTSDRTYSSGSEGSMDAQASSTADDVEMPAQSRNLLSFVESRAQITDLENQLGRLQARMLGGRNAQAAREEFQREADRRHRLAPPPQRHQFHIAPRSDSRGRYDAATAGDRSWASNATDGSNSVASLDGSSSSSVSIEVRASTPPRTVHSSEPPDQSEESTPTSNPASGPPARVWSLANSVQDIETELAHLSEGAARRSAELASLSQQLEQQTRQYAAHRSAVDSESGSPSGMRDHSDILGRASEGLRQLRELRERREQHERAEQIQQVWGNVDDEEYVSPVSALFQRSWQAYNRRQQLERDGVRPTLQSVWFPDGGGGGGGSSPSLTEPDPAPIRTPLDLITEAGEASNLLQSFLENHDGDSITPEQQELVDRAVEAILRMRREVRARSRSTRESSRRSRRSRGPGPGQRAWAEPKGLDDADRPPPMEPELLVLDCECKVCFGQIADTVLLPCSHLVLCGWCADQMGIRKASEFARTVQCPICRADVFDRIKIFRG